MAAMVLTVPVYEWLLADGTVIGCGTRSEFDFWNAEGIANGDRMGKIIGHEPAAVEAMFDALCAAR